MIREAIEIEMKRRGWTRYKLATEADLAPQAVYRYMAGKGGITAETAEKMLMALNLTIVAKDAQNGT